MDYIRQSLLTDATATNPFSPFVLGLGNVLSPSYGQCNMSQEQYAAMSAVLESCYIPTTCVPPNKVRAFQLLSEARQRHPEWQVKRLDAKRDIFGDYRHNGTNWDCFNGDKWVTDVDDPSEFFSGFGFPTPLPKNSA